MYKIEKEQESLGIIVIILSQHLKEYNLLKTLNHYTIHLKLVWYCKNNYTSIKNNEV